MISQLKFFLKNLYELLSQAPKKKIFIVYSLLIAQSLLDTIGIGLVVLSYVGYCLINQRVWIRRVSAWRSKDEHPKIFMMNIVLGVLIAAWLIVSSLVLG